MLAFAARILGIGMMLLGPVGIFLEVKEGFPLHYQLWVWVGSAAVTLLGYLIYRMFGGQWHWREMFENE